MTKAFLPSDNFRPGAGELAHLARAIMLGRGAIDAALLEAERRQAPERAVRLLKAAVGAGTTADEGWAGSLVDYRIASRAFVEALRNFSLFDRLLADGAAVRVPMGAVAISTTLTASGSPIQETTPKPISKLTLGANPKLPEFKAASIVAVTRELLDAAGAAGVQFLERELRRGVAASTDEIFAAVIRVDAATVASTGDDYAAVVADLATALEGVIITAESRPYWAMPAHTAKRLAIMQSSSGFAFPTMTPNGGTLVGIPAVVTDAVEDDEVLLLDARRIAADDSVITLQAARHAALAMDSEPSADAQPLTSLWQTNSTALRAERRIGAAYIGDEAGASVAITGVAWGAPPEPETGT